MSAEATDDARSAGLVAVPPAWREVADELLTDLDARPIFLPVETLVHDPNAHHVVAIATDRAVDTDLLDLPRLEVVSFSGTGVWELVDTDRAADRGIAVCNARDYATDAVAEHAWALILAAAKRLVAADATVRASSWPSSPWGCGLAGRTLGLLGVGTVGRRVAEIARAFGMRVVAWSARNEPATPPDASPGKSIVYVSRDHLLRVSDVVSVHGRYEPGMSPILGAKEIAALKPGAIIVNTARGGLVDAAALAAAVTSGRVRGAGLDVFDVEPLPSTSPLRDVPEIVLTPHIAAATEEALRQAVRQCLHNIADYLAGTPRNVVNLPVGRRPL